MDFILPKSKTLREIIYATEALSNRGRNMFRQF
jgi:hypothetical protein